MYYGKIYRKFNCISLILFIILLLTGCSSENKEVPESLTDIGEFTFTAIDFEEKEVRIRNGVRGSVPKTSYYIVMVSEDGTYLFYEPCESAVDAMTGKGMLGQPPITMKIQVFQDTENDSYYFFHSGTSEKKALDELSRDSYKRLETLK